MYPKSIHFFLSSLNLVLLCIALCGACDLSGDESEYVGHFDESCIEPRPEPDWPDDIEVSDERSFGPECVPMKVSAPDGHVEADVYMAGCRGGAEEEPDCGDIPPGKVSTPDGHVEADVYMAGCRGGAEEEPDCGDIPPG